VNGRVKLAFCTLFFGLGLAVAIDYGVKDRPLVGDTQLYFFIGERAASGVAPHVSQVDIKTQLGPILSGIAIKAGRCFGLEDVFSARVASVGATALAVALTFALTLEFTGSATAASVAGATLLTTHGLFFEAVTGSSPKVFLVPLLLAANLAAARRRWFGCGLAAIGAFLCWQPGAVILGGSILAVLLDRHSRWSDLARIVIGAAVAMLAYEAYFAWHGGLAEQLHQEFALAFSSSPRIFDPNESVWFFLTEARAYRQTPNVAPVTFVVVGALTLLSLIVLPRRGLAFARSRPGEVAFWSAALVGTAFTLYDHQAHPDMLLVQSSFAVACGIGFGWLVAALRRIPGGHALAMAAAAVIFVFCLLDARQDAHASAVRGSDLAQQVELARLIDVYRDHRGSVWVVGAAHLLGFERADNFVPHAYLAGPITREIDFGTYRPLRDGKMPEILLVSRGIFPGLHGWLRTEYQEITPAAFAAQRIRVFGRRQPGIIGPKPTPILKGSRVQAGQAQPKPPRPAKPAKPG